MDIKWTLYLLIIGFQWITIMDCETIKINDGILANTEIANLKLFAQKYPNEPNILFTLFTSSNNHVYFFIQNERLYTKKTLDLDGMCAYTKECCDRQSEICTISVEIGYRRNQWSTWTSSKIFIEITDVNDNKPVFKDTLLEKSIPENQKVGFTFTLPEATDADFGRNRVQRYEIGRKEPNSFEDYFRLEMPHPNFLKPKLRLSKQLDREQLSAFNFDLLAIDGATYERKTGTIQISIKVIDVNDHLPIFKKTYIRHPIEEGFFSEKSILKLEATDKDIEENGRIIYQFDPTGNFVEAKEYFILVEDTGEIFLKKKLDYEKLNSFRFTVIAINPVPPTDNIIPTSTATVDITVTNVYDEPLQIIIDYTNGKNSTAIQENSDTYFVCLISVKSAESAHVKSKTSCELDGNNDYLDLTKSPDNPLSYEVRTTKPIDRELTPTIRSKVRCVEIHEEKNMTQSYGLIVIEILDENDNAPVLKINDDAPRSIRENESVGKTVLIVSANDPDLRENGTVTFSLDKSKPSTLEYLHIGEKDGVIRIIKVIDREGTINPLTHLNLIITATDHGNPRKTSDLSFTIRIDDVNDNMPSFVTNPMQFKVLENSPPDEIGEIEVRDEDSEDKLQVLITTHRSPDFPFQIAAKNKRTFALKTTKPLDAESMDKYVFTVSVVDRTDGVSYTAMAQITVEVNDINDCAPVIIFPRPNNNTSHILSYKEQPNYYILTVSANDHDRTPENNRLTYRVDSDADIFDISDTTRHVFVRREMTKADIGDHEIRIIVTDSGTPSLQASVKVNIKIDDSLPKRSFGEEPKRKLPEYSKSSILDNSIFIALIIVAIIVFIFIICAVLSCFVLRNFRSTSRAAEVFGCIKPDHPRPIDKDIISMPIPPNFQEEPEYIIKDLVPYQTYGKQFNEANFQRTYSGKYCPANQPLYEQKPMYTKLQKSSPGFYGNDIHQYQTIGDPHSANVFFNARSNFKSEMNLNTDNLFSDFDAELSQLDPNSKLQWTISQTPMPIRSKSIVGPKMHNVENNEKFAVSYPKDESTFV